MCWFWILSFITFIIFIISSYFSYCWFIRNYNCFKKQGVPFHKPWPFIGSNLDLWRRKKPFPDVMHDWYYQFENEKISGLFDFNNPMYLIRDPKILKELAVKNFCCFMEHRHILSEEADPLFGKSLFVMKGRKWKSMRSILSPAFTGHKMRKMFTLMQDVGSQTAEEIRRKIGNGEDNVFEFRDLASRFTIDIIASCAFGIEVNSFQYPDNEFFVLGRKVANFSSVIFGLKIAGYRLFPWLMEAFKVKLIDKEGGDFFRAALLDTIKTRGINEIVRDDMINLMLEARKKSKRSNTDVSIQWEDDDFVAQCLFFFLGGFDTASQTMSFLAYELVVNTDIQRRLYEEIIFIHNEADGNKVTYNQIQSMKYLDQVVSETLRKWPVTPMVDRVCKKDYILNYDDKTIKIEKGTGIYIAIWSIHRDPKYYPEPENFDPDRFSDENKGNIDPDTYLPFGIGPKRCIGNQFALLEIKTIIFYLLLNFSFECAEKTQIPVKLAPTSYLITPVKGIWIKLTPRT